MSLLPLLKAAGFFSNLISMASPNLVWQRCTSVAGRCLILGLLCAAAAWGQSTQGLIAGQLTDSVTGRALSGATVTCSSEDIGFTASTHSDAFGYYYFPQLSPHTYSLTVTADKYQSQTLEKIVVPVAGRLELNWQIRAHSRS